jgi:Uncharacterized conserved protein
MSLPRFLFTLFFLTLPSFGATFGTVTADLGVADLILDEPRGKLYLINSNLNRVDVWSTAQRRFLSPITTGTNPLAGAMSPDGKFLYVTSYNQVSLNVIDLNKAALVQRVSLPANPEGIAVGGDGRVLITTIGAGPNNSQNTLLVYDPNAAPECKILPGSNRRYSACAADYPSSWPYRAIHSQRTAGHPGWQPDRGCQQHLRQYAHCFRLRSFLGYPAACQNRQLCLERAIHLERRLEVHGRIDAV